MTGPRKPGRAAWAKAPLALVPLAVVAAVWRSPALGEGAGVVETRLPNAVRLVVSEQHNLPLVFIDVLVDAGARLDPAGRAGTASLVAALLTEGTTHRDATTIHQESDQIGASLDGDANRDFVGVGLRVLKKDLAAGADLLADVLLHPSFAGKEVERAREAALAAWRSSRDDPTTVAGDEFRRAVFVDGPFSEPVSGTEETLARITRADLQAFYRRYFRPGRATVVVVGDVTSGETQALVGRLLGEWNEDPVAVPEPELRPAPPAETRLRQKAVKQAAVVLGHRGVARSHPDYEKLVVLNYVLGGGGFSSRLMDSIRTKAGLAYSVSSFFATSRYAGTFQVVLQTKNESVAEAIRLVREEIGRIREQGVTDEELEEARRYLTGSFPLRIDSNGELTDFLGEAAFYDLGFDYARTYTERVNSVTKEEVLRVAREFLHPEALVEVVVADLPAAGLNPSANEPAR